MSWLIFGILMQVELSNIVLLPILFIFLFENKKEISDRLMVLSFLIFGLTWTGKFIYDLKNGFSQTFGFGFWLIYRILPINLENKKMFYYPLSLRLERIGEYFSRIIYWQSIIFSTLLIIFLIFYLFYKFNFKNRKQNFKYYLLFLWIIFPITALIIHGAPSEGYIPVLFGLIPLLIGVFLESQKKLFTLFSLGILLLSVNNISTLIKNNYFMLDGKTNKFIDRYNFGQSYRITKNMTEYLINDIDNNKYNLIAMGDFAYFSSAIQNFNYLTWYYGNGQSSENQKIKYFLFYNYEDKTIVGEVLRKKFEYMTIVKAIKND
jgi:hypothetical protein